jgi:hypothetical protein
VFGERADLGQVPERMAADGVVAERLVRRHAGRHRRGAFVAQVFHARCTPSALTAHRHEGHHHVVTHGETGCSVADFDHRAGTFMAADHREHRR